MSDREKERARRFLEQATREYISLLPSSRNSAQGSLCGNLRDHESDIASVTSKRSHSSQFANTAAELRTRQYVENISNSMVTPGEDMSGVVPQVDGNETCESQDGPTIGQQTPLFQEKEFQKFSFEAPGSANRREMESSPLTEVGSLNSRSESKGDTPDSQRSQGEHSLLASFGDTVIGGITKKLGNFKLGFGNKQKRTSVTPENPPDQDFNRFQETATTKVNPENQEIGIDFSHVQVPSNMSQQQTDSHSWSTGAQFGEGFYEETPFRPSKDLRTGFTDPQFQSRLPRSFYEENAEDFSEVDLEVREQIRTGTRPKTKIGLTDTDDYQKAKNAVTQYKSMITKLCNRLNGSYKTISSAQITKELEDIECSLDVFQGLCGELLTFDMSSTEMEKIETSFPKYKNRLLDTMGLLTTELQVREDDLRHFLTQWVF